MGLADITFISLLLFFITASAGIFSYMLKIQDVPNIIFSIFATITFSISLVFYVDKTINSFIKELYMHDAPLTKHQASIVIKKDYFDVNKPIIFKEETNLE